MKKGTLLKMLGLSRNSRTWKIVNGYLNDKYNQMVMFCRLVDLFDGDQKQANMIAWQVADWQAA